ncbi:MAG TPA: AMP-binding protein [Actinopolymorphaceae bacterium]|nr:AMP-binding protein [Actinopolymorphaceae bacterium]
MTDVPATTDALASTDVAATTTTPRPLVPRQTGPRRTSDRPVRTRLKPNLGDYRRVHRDFSWEAARGWLSGLPRGRGLNIAYEAVDRHAETPRAEQVALRYLGPHERVSELTYDELRTASNRFANLLRSLGVQAGDRVFTLLDSGPEVAVTAFGTLKNACVYAPLPGGLGSDAIRHCLESGAARVLVTTAEHAKRTIAPIRASLPGLAHVLVVDVHAGSGSELDDGARDLHAALAKSDEEFDIPATDPADLALLHFTAGTTGTPKGILHAHEAVVAQHATAAYALDLHAGDVLWCTADPGSVTGTAYGLIAPLTHGATLVVDGADLDARGSYELLQEQRVTVWYTSPVEWAKLMREGVDLARSYDLSSLRFIATVGEPLPPRVVLWGQEAFGRPVHDSWCQTESGAIMISNFASMDIRPGSMGRPMPGVKAVLLACGDDGRVCVSDGEVREVTHPDEIGELALRPGWPSMFRGYLGDDDRYDDCFAGGWYLTGDLARRDNDGFFWSAGRVDDVVTTSTRPVGAFELERVLLEHPAVADAAVIGTPGAHGESVKAFVTIRSGWTPSEDLRAELLACVSCRLPPETPAAVSFESDLPRTRHGTILRRLLRDRELEPKPS